MWGVRGSPQQFHVKGRAQTEVEGTTYVISQIKRPHGRRLDVPLLSEGRWLWKMACFSNNLSLTLKAPGDKTPHSPCHLGCWEIHLHTICTGVEWERVRVLTRGTVLWRFLFKISECARPCGENRLASQVAQMVKNPPAMWETWVQSLGREDPLEEDVATHSSILTWRIPTDRGSWWAMVHGVAESRTRLNDSTQCVTHSGGCP